MKLHRVAGLALCLAGAACDRTPEPAPPSPAAAPAADHVFLNGYIYTADGKGTVAEALAVRGDRISFVGSNAEARTFVGESTRVHGLDGKMVMPGLHDVHIHLLGLPERKECNLESRPLSLEELVPVLSACLAAYPLEDGWLAVAQWNFAVGNQPSDRYPTLRSALDAVSTEVPVFLRGNDGHHAAVNSKALARAALPGQKPAGLSAATLDAQFRAWRRYVGVDAQGEPDGSLGESARKLVRPPDIWGFTSINPDLVRGIPQLLARSGITSAQDAAMAPEDLALFEELARLNRMTFRLTAALFPDLDRYRDRATGKINIDGVIAELRAAREHYRGHPVIKATAAKIFIDGVIEGNPWSVPPSLPNAAVLQPYRQPIFNVEPGVELPMVSGYVDSQDEACIPARTATKAVDAAKFRAEHGFHPQQCEVSRGSLEHDEAFIRNYMHALQEEDFVIHAHAIGDRAVRVATANFRALREEFGKPSPPHCIAHAQLVHPLDRDRLGALGLCVAMTYAWIGPNPAYDLSVTPFIDTLKSNDDLYNPRGYVMRNAYPAHSLMEEGALLTAGSDAPVDTRDPRPFINMMRAVTRANAEGQVWNAGERLDIQDVIKAYTLNGARALQQEELTGSLEPGKKADIIVLSQNLVELAGNGEAARIGDTQILMTMFDGRIIYQDN